MEDSIRGLNEDVSLKGDLLLQLEKINLRLALYQVLLCTSLYEELLKNILLKSIELVVCLFE